MSSDRAMEFVSEPIDPVPGSFLPDAMLVGLAALPGAFQWRGRRYEITACRRHVKQSTPEGQNPDGERYLRRQEFEVDLDSGQAAVIYVERQARSGARGRSAKKRWFLYAISSSTQG